MEGQIAINLEEMSEHEVVQLCDVCYLDRPPIDFVELSLCGHKFCIDCLQVAFHNSIGSSRANIQCLKCETEVPYKEVKKLVDENDFGKYLDYTLRRYLATVPNVRYCLSPDCPFACIELGKNRKSKTKDLSEVSENHFICQIENCKKEYCYDCKLSWHPGMSCQEARAAAPDEDIISEETLKQINAKQCPSCKTIIEKMNDGSCNQVSCTACQTDFCWLCLQPVSEMHFFSPTGCPIYGRRRWNRKKRYCCRFWLWALAPFLTLVISLLMIPIIIVLLPIGVGYLVYHRGKAQGCSKANKIIFITIGVIITLFLSPLVGILGGLLLIPILLFYAYCFVPVQICRLH